LRIDQLFPMYPPREMQCVAEDMFSKSGIYPSVRHADVLYRHSRLKIQNENEKGSKEFL